MDYLEGLRTFVAIAEAGSFVGGARQRGLSAPSVTRSLAALEGHLGVQLIVRSTRAFRLTEVGAAFLVDARRVLSALEHAEATVSGRRVRPEGLLSITAPELFGQRHIAPLVFEFLELHPQLRAKAFFSNRIVNLIDEGFDVGLRIGHLPDSRLTAVPLGKLSVVWVASPAYLARTRAPRQAEDLAAHPMIGLSIEGQEQIVWERRGKRRSSVALSERLLVNENSVKIAAAVAGLGVTRALAYQVADEVRDGRLRVLLTAGEPRAVPVHLVYPEGRAAAANVREFLSFATPRLRAIPLLDGKRPTAKPRPRK
ncbi:MAG: LysR family transcriptional regulator [Polyangiaceae bacterium]|nr:LysR family transcriptional regulator [Myxococcales bacterium]MCB9588734.1 LysR family transcriptional regulator [Polyangiaceae bacterium]MCB9605292.1 LysR family transcriptional regulator [Polyangiaceae bacterium]